MARPVKLSPQHLAQDTEDTHICPSAKVPVLSTAHGRAAVLSYSAQFHMIYVLYFGYRGREGVAEKRNRGNSALLLM